MFHWNSANWQTPAWSQAGGHFEARMKLPSGKGLWPAFWSTGANCTTVAWPLCGEIDTMEQLGNYPAVVEQHAHGGSTDISWGGGYTLPHGASTTDWHTYAIDWDASAQGYIKWSVDGIVTRTLTAAAAGSAWNQSFLGPQSLIMELAVGGDWPGNPDGTTVFPAKMYVNWIHVYSEPIN
jgi:beta-glucanase (GH16 family)